MLEFQIEWMSCGMQFITNLFHKNTLRAFCSEGVVLEGHMNKSLGLPLFRHLFCNDNGVRALAYVAVGTRVVLILAL